MCRLWNFVFLPSDHINTRLSLRQYSLSSMPRAQLKIPRLRCEGCLRRFSSTAGLSNHYNSAHVRKAGHIVTPPSSSPPAAAHNLPPEEDEHQPPQFGPENEFGGDNGPNRAADARSRRDHHPILDGNWSTCLV